MKALLLALLSLVALGCGSAEPVSASPDAAGDVVSADVATASDRWCGRGGACVRFAGWFRCA